MFPDQVFVVELRIPRKEAEIIYDGQDRTLTIREVNSDTEFKIPMEWINCDLR